MPLDRLKLQIRTRDSVLKVLEDTGAYDLAPYSLRSLLEAIFSESLRTIG